MARTESDDVARHQVLARDRVLWVLTHRYAGRQRVMARATGISQATLSRVVHGQFSVSQDVIEAVAALPGINPDWARSGVGEPLLPAAAGTLPVAVGVLPGPPAESPGLLTGERQPVAAALDRPTRYFLRVDGECPLLAARDLALLAGDLFLMDADAAVWRGRVEQLTGRVFGVCERRPDGPVYGLGVLRRDDQGLYFDLYPRRLRPGRPLPPERVDIPAPYGMRGRRIDPKLFGIGKLPKQEAPTDPVPEKPASEAAADPVPPPPAPAVDPAVPVFRFDDLVALRTYTFRPGP